MRIYHLDGEGSLTLPQKSRESLKMGKKVLVINAGDHLKVIPLPADPLGFLHGAFTVDKSFRELRRQAEATAPKDQDCWR